MRSAILIAICASILLTEAADAQQLTINSVSVSRLAKANLCPALGGSRVPPVITVRHSKASGTMTVSMIDRRAPARGSLLAP